MKNLIILLAFSFQGLPGISQDTPVTYAEVIQMDSLKQGELFQSAREWVNETYRSAKDVLQLNDKETGELSGKAISGFLIKKEPYETRYAFSIFVKDGKYKYEFTHFIVATDRENQTTLGLLTSGSEAPIKWPMVSQKKMNEIYGGAKDGVDNKMKSLVASLKEKMSSKSKKDF